MTSSAELKFREHEVPVTVQQANIQALEQIVPLFDGYRQFYGKPSDPALARAFLAERLERQQSVVFLAVDGEGSGLGFTQLYPSFSSVSARRTYILNDLFVAPAARRRGIAALLLKAAAEFGRSAGAVRLSLSTALSNTSAQKLYESQNWQADEVYRVYHLPL